MPFPDTFVGQFPRAPAQTDVAHRTCLRYRNGTEIAYSCRAGGTQTDGFVVSSRRILGWSYSWVVWKADIGLTAVWLELEPSHLEG